MFANGEAETKPHVMEWDESQHFPEAVFKELGRMGVLGAVFPEELGGSGYSYIDYSIVVEKLARVDPSVALMRRGARVAVHQSYLSRGQRRSQKRSYIPKLASGEWIGSWALTEPESGSDAGGTHTRAVPEGDQWVINGSQGISPPTGRWPMCAW